MNSYYFIPVPARLDDSADVVEDGHGPLPAGQQVQRVRRFLSRRGASKINHRSVAHMQAESHNAQMNGRDGRARTSTVLTMELRTVGRPLLPTRTSAAASRFWNRTSIVGMSIPTLQQ